MFNYIKVDFISNRTFVCFQKKRHLSIHLLIKVVLTLFKKLSNDIDGLGIFFAKDGSISAKYLLNSI